MKKLLWLFSLITIAFTACKKDKDEPQSKAVVSTTNASSITSSGAATGGSITDDGGSPITQRGVVWATHADPSLTDSVLADPGSSATWVSNLTNLKANTTYHVRAYATNAQGTAYGNEVSFKTAAGLATITTNAITENVALSAKGGGEVVNDGGTTVTVRGIVYGTTPNPTTANLKIESGTGPGTFTVTIPTASEVTYYVRAFATNSAGTAYGEEISFKAISSNSVGDIDGNVYGTVTLGTQTWTTSNLRVVRYRNGDPITDGSSATFNWVAINGVDPNPAVGAWTYANGNPANDAQHGKYYNALVVLDARGVCPQGWHVPTEENWKALESNLGVVPSSELDSRGCRGSGASALFVGGASGLNLTKSGSFRWASSGGLAVYSGFNESVVYMSGTQVNPPDDPRIWWRGFGLSACGSGASYRDRTDPSVVTGCIRCVKD